MKNMFCKYKPERKDSHPQWEKHVLEQGSQQVKAEHGL